MKPKTCEELYKRIRAVVASLGKYRYEHIFIDNASTDGTVAILKRIAAADPNVKIHRQCPQRGPYPLAYACLPPGHRRLRDQHCRPTCRIRPR